jgi:hypothetical protein
MPAKRLGLLLGWRVDWGQRILPLSFPEMPDSRLFVVFPLASRRMTATRYSLSACFFLGGTGMKWCDGPVTRTTLHHANAPPCRMLCPAILIPLIPACRIHSSRQTIVPSGKIDVAPPAWPAKALSLFSPHPTPPHPRRARAFPPCPIPVPTPTTHARPTPPSVPLHPTSPHPLTSPHPTHPSTHPPPPPPPPPNGRGE